jgi:hypothetical protein
MPRFVHIVLKSWGLVRRSKLSLLCFANGYVGETVGQAASQPHASQLAPAGISMVNAIKDTALAYTMQASSHRLNQLPRPQNPNLAKALLNQRNSLYKQKKQDVLRVEAELYKFPEDGKAPQKV